MWISAHTEHLGIHYKYTGKYCIWNTLVLMALLQCVVGGEHLGIGVKICARWEFHQQLPSLTPTQMQHYSLFCKWEKNVCFYSLWVSANEAPLRCMERITEAIQYESSEQIYIWEGGLLC